MGKYLWWIINAKNNMDMDENKNIKSNYAPKVSVLVPVYGVENYIERCAKSLFAQSLDSIEFIFVDDCSPDKSIEILSSVVDNNHQRFDEMNWTVIIDKMPKNSGLPAVRRHGLQLAKGEYVIHCDSDDWVEPDMYRLMYEKAKEEDADIVVCDLAIVNECIHTTYKGCLHTDIKQFIQDCCYMKTSWSGCNKLIRRRLFDSSIIYPTGNMGEDMALTLQVLLKANNLAYVPGSLYNYYSNPDSITKVISARSLLAKYDQFIGNVSIIIPLLNNDAYAGYYSDCILSLKWKGRQHIWGLVHDRKYYRKWRDTFPEVDEQLLHSCGISNADKIRYVLTRLRLYPFKKDRVVTV